MRRYVGEGLPANPRVAVIANDAIGNFVVATPLLQMIRRELKPSFLTYFGGKRTWEMQVASDLFEATYALHGTPLDEAVRAGAGKYDLIVNVENGPHAKAFAGAIAAEAFVSGPASVGGADVPFPADDRGDLSRDREWIAADLTSKYPFLRTGWIAEIYARLTYLEGKVPDYRVPKEPVLHDFDVLIATSASLSEKLWTRDKWFAALTALADRGLKVGLLGAKPSDQKAHWKGADDETMMVESGLLADLRGKWTLPQVVGALEQTRAVLTLDNGILHLAAAAGSPTVGLFRNGIHRLWAPPSDRLTVLVPKVGEPVSEIGLAAVMEAMARVV
jgi:hypothetical protein